MQLTRFTDLGLRVIMRLAVSPGGGGLTTSQVADEMSIPYTHTTKVVLRLKELGMIEARRGRGGGLTITDRARGTTVGWLTRQLEGDDEVVTCDGATPCPLRGGCKLRGALRRAQNAFYDSLDEVTIDDLVREPRDAQVLLSLSVGPN
ncbi:RrF2 family transcriptional regulator [Rhodococcus sp. NPDC003318]|uniref:RrF2 family transcriptional regulator n=1 Tax=Rhodococcus sp. NPDC003318 TaxID=3364503 RepID=UPI003692C13E